MEHREVRGLVAVVVVAEVLKLGRVDELFSKSVGITWLFVVAAVESVKELGAVEVLGEDGVDFIGILALVDAVLHFAAVGLQEVEEGVSDVRHKVVELVVLLLSHQHLLKRRVVLPYPLVLQHVQLPHLLLFFCHRREFDLVGEAAVNIENSQVPEAVLNGKIIKVIKGAVEGRHAEKNWRGGLGVVK